MERSCLHLAGGAAGAAAPRPGAAVRPAAPHQEVAVAVVVVVGTGSGSGAGSGGSSYASATAA